VDDRVVQIDRRSNQIRNAAAVRTKFGVDPEFIADYLALVGDSADGYPGIPGCGAKTAANLINRYGHIEKFPAEVFQQNNRELALLFKDLATLRTSAPLFKNVEALRWQGPLDSFPAVAKQIDDVRLAERVQKLAQTHSK